MQIGCVINPTTMIQMLLSKELDGFGVFDAFYITVTVGLLILVMMPMYRCASNVLNQTDEVLKFKKNCTDPECGDGQGKKKKKKAEQEYAPLTW